MFRFLFVCGLCSALAASPRNKLIDTVKAVVEKTNLYIAENNLDLLPLPDFSDEGSLHELHITNSRVGNFSTAGVKDVTFVNMTEFGGSKQYAFDVVLSLNQAEIDYSFLLAIEGLFPMSGKVKVVANSNSYEVRGIVLTERSGSCQAVLERCKFRELKNFNVNIQPKSVSYISPAKKYLLDIITPHYTPRINKRLAEVIQRPKFQEVFTNIVCRNIEKLSR